MIRRWLRGVWNDIVLTLTAFLICAASDDDLDTLIGVGEIERARRRRGHER